MPTTITVDSVARAYAKATDPNYQKQLDRGDTGLGVYLVDGTCTLLDAGTGMSHLIKTHNRAGAGRRSSIALKDETTHPTTLVTEKNTVVFSFYGPYGSANSIVRLQELFKGLSALFGGAGISNLEELLIGQVSVPD